MIRVESVRREPSTSPSSDGYRIDYQIRDLHTGLWGQSHVTWLQRELFDAIRAYNGPGIIERLADC